CKITLGPRRHGAVASTEGVYASRRFSAHRCLPHRCCRGQRNWLCYPAVSGCAFGTEAHRHHQRRRCFVRSWQATARPRASGSAASSSATLIASNVTVLSADPFRSQSPPLGTLGGILFSPSA